MHGTERIAAKETFVKERPLIPQYCMICRSGEPGTTRHPVLGGYVCLSCERRKSYSQANRIAVGRMGRLPTFSVEFEVAAPFGCPESVNQALVLLKHGFVRTYDGTVDDEYKSPIYCSVRAFRKPLAVLDTLRHLVDERCGTHLHVGFQATGVLYAVRQEVFGKLIGYMHGHEAQTIHFWGRTFSPQAGANLQTEDRHVCINVGSRYPTIEFRLPRFRSADQYLAVVQFCRTATAFLNEEFSLNISRKPLEPSQIGDRVLALYRKAVIRWEVSAPTASLTIQEEEESVCVD